jgi:hypothetical protein
MLTLSYYWFFFLVEFIEAFSGTKDSPAFFNISGVWSEGFTAVLAFSDGYGLHYLTDWDASGSSGRNIL